LKHFDLVQNEFMTELYTRKDAATIKTPRVLSPSKGDLGSFLKEMGEREVRNPDLKAKKPRIKIKSLKGYDKNSPQQRLFRELYKQWKGTGVSGVSSVTKREDKLTKLQEKLKKQREELKKIKREQKQPKLKEKLDAKKTELKNKPTDKAINNEIKSDKVEEQIINQKKIELDKAGDKTEQYQQKNDRIKANEGKLKNDISFLNDPPPPSKGSIEEVDHSVDAIRRSFTAANIKGSNIAEATNAPNSMTFKIKFDDDVAKVKGTRWLLSNDGKNIISSMVGKDRDVIISEDRKSGMVNIEVPKDDANRDTVYLKDILTSDKFVNESSNPKKLVVPFGKDANGEVIIHDFKVNPHMLVAGGTGSGKSVFINSMVNSLMATQDSDHVKFVMLDVAKKGNEFGLYDGSKYLADPVAKDENSAIKSLQNLHKESGNRFKKIQELSKKSGLTFKDTQSFNAFIDKKDKTEEEKVAFEKLAPEERKVIPQIFLVADEVKSLLNPEVNKNASKIKGYIDDMLAVARQSGINIILATQSPALKAIPRQLQANLGSKVILHLNQHADAESVDLPDATDLLSHGDAFYAAEGQPKKRFQSGFVSGNESTKFSEKSQGKQDLLQSIKPKEESTTIPKEEIEKQEPEDEYSNIKKQIEARRKRIKEILGDTGTEEEISKSDITQKERNEQQKRREEEIAKKEEERKKLLSEEPEVEEPEEEPESSVDDDTQKEINELSRTVSAEDVRKNMQTKKKHFLDRLNLLKGLLGK